MIMMKTVFSLLFLAIATVSSAQQFQRIADSIRKVRGIPAIGYAVFSSNKIIDRGVAGFRKYKLRDSVQMQDRFNIGTNSFAFTSFVAARLVEAGKIKWTTTFASLFPDQKKKMQPEFQNVDLKSLLTNTAALPPYTTVNEYQTVPTFMYDLKNQRKEFASWVMQKPPLNPKRDKKIVESIAGYTIAASMLEKATGSTMEKLIDDYVAKPLNISIKFGWPNKISQQQPSGHWSSYGSMTAEPSDTWVKVYPPASAIADINLSIADYVKFLQENLRGLRGEKSLLSKNIATLLHYGVVDHAFGWDNGVIGENRISSHIGQSFLFSCYVELIPEKNLGVVVVCNNGDSAGRAGVLNLCRILRDFYLSNPSQQ